MRKCIQSAFNTLPSVQQKLNKYWHDDDDNDDYDDKLSKFLKMSKGIGEEEGNNLKG